MPEFLYCTLVTLGSQLRSSAQLSHWKLCSRPTVYSTLSRKKGLVVLGQHVSPAGELQTRAIDTKYRGACLVAVWLSGAKVRGAGMGRWESGVQLAGVYSTLLEMPHYLQAGALFTLGSHRRRTSFLPLNPTRPMETMSIRHRLVLSICQR